MLGDHMKNQKLSASLAQNETTIDTLFENSRDLRRRTTELFGHRMVLLFLDSMTNKDWIARNILRPLFTAPRLPQDDADCFDYLCSSVLYTAELLTKDTVEDVEKELTVGSAVLLMEGVPRAVCMNVKGFAHRAIKESNREVTELGVQESFIELTVQNLAMITRRLTTADLKSEDVEVGRAGSTVTVVYLKGCAEQSVVQQIKQRLQQADLPAVLDSTYLRDHLSPGRWTLFNRVGSTTRPDVLCAKLQEGRIGIFVEGSPEALTLPYLFFEELQTPDDYCKRPFFATFVRCVKLLAVILSILLPGSYAALCMFNPEAFPAKMLYNLINADLAVPFTVATEVILMQVLYEIMYEAGLRLPRPAGQSVSIVGSLVIGEAAVTSGLIGAPTVIVSAVSVICAFVAPAIYSQIALLRFVFILTGTVFGIYGVMIAAGALVICLCAQENWGAAFLSPLLPAKPLEQRDALLRAPWHRLGKGRVYLGRRDKKEGR